MQSWQYLRLNINDYLLKNGTSPMTGNLDMSSNRINNLLTPSVGTDATNKNYVDTSLNNLKNYVDISFVNIAGAQSISGVKTFTNTIQGNISGALTGNATTATTLQTPRTLWGQSFNGSAPVSGSLIDVTNIIPVAGQTITLNPIVGSTPPAQLLDVSGNAKIRGNLDMNNTNKIINLANPTLLQDAATKNYVDSQDNLKVNKSGDTMTGALTISSSNASTNTDKQLLLNRNNNNNDGIWFHTNLSSGSFNGMVGTNDKALIFSDGTPGTGNLVIGNWGNEGLKIIGSSGNVGIGTNNPTTKLQVAGSAIINNDLGVSGSATVAGKINASHLQLVSGGNINSQGTWIDWNSVSGQGRTAIMNQKGGGPGGIEFGQSDQSNNRTVNMFLDGSGNLGIGTGTTTPSEKLQVAGSAIINNDLGVSGSATIGTGLSISNGKLTINETTGTPASATNGSLVIQHQNNGGTSSIVFPSKQNYGSDYGYIQYVDTVGTAGTEKSQLTIGVENDPDASNEDSINFRLNGADRVKISGSGNVGIGTTTPAHALDVNGSINLTSRLALNGNIGTPGFTLKLNSITGLPIWSVPDTFLTVYSIQNGNRDFLKTKSNQDFKVFSTSKFQVAGTSILSFQFLGTVGQQIYSGSSNDSANLYFRLVSYDGNNNPTVIINNSNSFYIDQSSRNNWVDKYVSDFSAPMVFSPYGGQIQLELFCNNKTDDNYAVRWSDIVINILTYSPDYILNNGTLNVSIS